MKDGNLKNQIQDEFAKITPDIKAKVIASCADIVQEEPVVEEKKPNVWLKRAVVAFACLVFFIGGALMGFFMPEPVSTVQAETLLYLDVNPSVEITLDVDNKVLSVKAGNEDASDILHGLELKNVELNTALNAVVGAMYIHGYLSEDSNSILVSIDTKHNENESSLLSYVTEKINKVFENSDLDCSILAQSLDVDEDLKKRAEEQGVSVGKMHLVDKLKEIDGFEESPIDDLVGMSIKDLNHIYSSSDKKNKNDVVSGNVHGYINKDEAVDLLLTHLNVTHSDIENIRVVAYPTFCGNALQINYLITIKISANEYRFFEMDCKTGEITELELTGGSEYPPFEGGGENPSHDNKNHDENQSMPENGNHQPPQDGMGDNNEPPQINEGSPHGYAED